MSRSKNIFVASLIVALLANASACVGGNAKYFVLVVWDGMQPDYVSPELTPTLHQMRETGVWFARHHSVYPTSTEVNGTVLATGVFPQRNGITANKEYRAEIDPLKQYGTEALAAVRRGDAISGGKYLRTATLSEMIQSAGGRTAVVGAKPVALLHDRLPRPASSDNQVWFVQGCLPEGLLYGLTNQLGSFPAAVSPNIARDDWATRCLFEAFWENEIPRYSLLWLSEPDFSQHRHGPGSAQALAAIRHCDQKLAVLLSVLDKRGIRSNTDVIVVSDHGFSTIGRNGDMATTLQAADIPTKATWEQPPREGDVVVVGNGGSVLLYVTGKSEVTIQKVVTTLQKHPDTGVIFTRTGLPGTFCLREVMLDSASAPDVLVASTWKQTARKGPDSQTEITNDGYSEYAPGGGMHVTLSPTDLHNLAVASGPDFRRGLNSSLPSGNVDIVPTLVWLMGLTSPEPLDGRVLFEALTVEKSPLPVSKPGQLNVRREFDDGIWKQYLKFVEVNGVRYLEEGNGGWSPQASSGDSKRTQ